MIPFVVAGGILMALGFAVSGAGAMSYPEEGLERLDKSSIKSGTNMRWG